VIPPIKHVFPKTCQKWRVFAPEFLFKAKETKRVNLGDFYRFSDKEKGFKRYYYFK